MERKKVFDPNKLNINDIRRFAESPSTFKVILEGQAGDVHFDSFVYLRFDVERRERVVTTLTGNPKRTWSDFVMDNKVLALKLPDEILRLGLRDASEEQILADMIRYGSNRMPYILLAFGTHKQTGQEVVTLYSTPSISPKTALTKIQEASKARKNRYN